MSDDLAGHWDHVHRTKGADAVSWYRPVPQTSLRFVELADPAHGPLVDIGGGSGTLVDELLAAGWQDLTVVDISAPALDLVRDRIPRGAANLVVSDIRGWVPDRDFTVWHDRAALHFLTAADEQSAYAALARRAIRPGGAAVLATFAPDGPRQCSGLPTARYSAAGLAELMGPAFRLEYEERELHVTPSGSTQAFTWVLLRRVE